jgi:hypothetical protein
VWLWIWMWFWGIYIPNCYGSGTTRARGAPHGDGREGVFGSLPSIGTRSPHLSATGRLVIASQSAALCGEMPCRFPGVPCNTFTAHPAAPLGSGAAFRRHSATRD